MSETKILIPKSSGGSLSAIHFITSNNLFKDSNKKAPFVIICHGFTGDKYEWGRFSKTANILNDEGFDALIFDFSGSGENERELILLSKQVKDLEDVYAWAKRQNYSWIAIIGLSFGGLTLLIADLPGIKTTIFWAPGFNIMRMLKRGNIELVEILKNLRRPPLKLPSSGDFEPIWIDYSFIEDILNTDVNTHLRKFTTPALIVQGKADTTINPIYTREAFGYFPQDEHHKMIEIDNAGHDFKDDHLIDFINISIDWLKKYL